MTRNNVGHQWDGASLRSSAVPAGEFYLVPRLNETQGGLGTQVSSLDNIGLLPSLRLVLTRIKWGGISFEQSDCPSMPWQMTACLSILRSVQWLTYLGHSDNEAVSHVWDEAIDVNAQITETEGKVGKMWVKENWGRNKCGKKQVYWKGDTHKINQHVKAGAHLLTFWQGPRLSEWRPGRSSKERNGKRSCSPTHRWEKRYLLRGKAESGGEFRGFNQDCGKAPLTEE